MALEALVTVEIKAIRDVPASVTKRSHAYALVTIGARRFGRSRRIAAGGTFDLTAEPQPWKLDMAVSAGESIPIELELWEDRGDDDPDGFATVTGKIPSPWTDGEVEIGTGPKLLVKVTTLRVRFARTAVRAKRAPDPDTTSATIRVRRAILVELTEIKGLYKPGHDPGPTPGRPRRLAEYEAGYVSDDDRGRTYINRDLKGHWKKNTQLIQLTVKITLNGALLPAGTKVKWTVSDPDDPTNDDPKIHRQWGHYIDPNDYDASGVHAGASAKDNPRAFKEAAGGSIADIYDKRPPWEAVTGFTLSDKTDTEAKTTISSANESKVKLHCPNVGGTNLIVRAELDPAPSIPTLPARSGIMTMWKRIDVEVARMDGAFSVASFLKNIPTYYEPACVQMDFHPETVLPSGPKSPDHMSPADNTVTARSSAWINRVFKNRKKPGWFFLGAAKRAHPPPSGGASGNLFDSTSSGASYAIGRDKDTGERIGWEYVDINKKLDKSKPTEKVEAVMFVWMHGTKTVKMHFRVWKQELVSSGTKTRLHYVGHDIQSRFTGHDANGSSDHAYKARTWVLTQTLYDSLTNAFKGKGYDVPTSGAAKAQLLVMPEEPGETAGISPFVKIGGARFFAGRTIIFTHHPGYSDHTKTPPAQKARFGKRAPLVITHEFAHAFGMPHKCGYWDDKLKRNQSCCMNYWYHWLLKPGRHDELEPLSDRKGGPRLCGRHLMEIRRVHMENNGGLRWK